MKYSAIILAAGQGTRIENAVPKQFIILAGKPILFHTLERLNQIPEIAEIIIVTLTDYIATVENMISNRLITKPYKIISGGATRQESIFIGINASTCENIMIHEAARPFVTTENFKKLLEAPQKNVIFGTPIPFTVVGGNEKIETLYERSHLVNVQLPQKFSKSTLLEAHKKAKEENKSFTEDASLLFYYDNTDISILEGMDYNIKITHPKDLLIGEIIYAEYILGSER